MERMSGCWLQSCCGSCRIERRAGAWEDGISMDWVKVLVFVSIEGGNMVLDSRVWLERVSERERWVVASGGEGWNGLGLD